MLTNGLMYGFVGCRSARGEAEATHIRHYKCARRNRFDRKGIEEQHQMEVSNTCVFAIRVCVWRVCKL